MYLVVPQLILTNQSLEHIPAGSNLWVCSLAPYPFDSVPRWCEVIVCIETGLIAWGRNCPLRASKSNPGAAMVAFPQDQWNDLQLARSKNGILLAQGGMSSLMADWWFVFWCSHCLLGMPTGCHHQSTGETETLWCSPQANWFESRENSIMNTNRSFLQPQNFHKTSKFVHVRSRHWASTWRVVCDTTAREVQRQLVLIGLLFLRTMAIERRRLKIPFLNSLMFLLSFNRKTITLPSHIYTD